MSHSYTQGNIYSVSASALAQGAAKLTRLDTGVVEAASWTFEVHDQYMFFQSIDEVLSCLLQTDNLQAKETRALEMYISYGGQPFVKADFPGPATHEDFVFVVRIDCGQEAVCFS